MVNEIFCKDIENITKTNNDYRRILYTSSKLQLVVMSVEPLDTVRMEKHTNIEQFIRVEDGNGIAIVDGSSYDLKDGTVIIIPPNTQHQITNTSEKHKLKFYTIYTPPEHTPDDNSKTNPDNCTNNNAFRKKYNVLLKKYLKYKQKYLNEKSIH